MENMKFYLVEESLGDDGMWTAGIVKSVINGVKLLFKSDCLCSYSMCRDEKTGDCQDLWEYLGFAKAKDFNEKDAFEKIKDKTDDELIEFVNKFDCFIRPLELWEPTE